MWHHKFLIFGILAEASPASPAPKPLKALVYEEICGYLQLDDQFGDWHISERDIVLEMERSDQGFRLSIFGAVRRELEGEGGRRLPPLFYGITCSGIAQWEKGRWRLTESLECDDELLDY